MSQVENSIMVMNERFRLPDYYTHLAMRITKSSRRAYLGDIEQFIHWLQGMQYPPLPALFTTALLEEYCSHCFRVGKKPNSVRRLIASLRSWFSFLLEQGEIAHDPTIGMEIPEPEEVPAPVIDEVERLLILGTPDRHTMRGLRDAAMMHVLFDTGMQVSELVALQLGNLNLETGQLSVKRRRSSCTYRLEDPLIEVLRSYLERRQEFYRDEQVMPLALFLRVGAEPMTRQGFWKLFKGYVRRSGIERNITAQMLIRPMEERQRRLIDHYSPRR